MGRCRCGGCVVFGEPAIPKAGAESLRCGKCGHVWRDNGERCTVGVTSDTPVAWYPKCGSAMPPTEG